MSKECSSWIWDNREILGNRIMCKCGKFKTVTDVIAGDLLFDRSCRDCKFKGPDYHQAVRAIRDIVTIQPKEDEKETVATDKLSPQVWKWLDENKETLNTVISCNKCGKRYRLVHYVLGLIQEPRHNCLDCGSAIHPNYYQWEKWLQNQS